MTGLSSGARKAAVMARLTDAWPSLAVGRAHHTDQWNSNTWIYPLPATRHNFHECLMEHPYFHVHTWSNTRMEPPWQQQAKVRGRPYFRSPMERHISSSNHTMITSCPPSPSSGCALTYLSSTVFFYITSEKHKTLEHVFNPSSVL